MGTWLEDRGNVIGNRPPGFTAPLRARATARGPSSPECHASRNAGTASIHAAVTKGRPLNMTTADGVPVAATARINSSWAPGSRRSLREFASPDNAEGSPTATTIASKSAASVRPSPAGKPGAVRRRRALSQSLIRSWTTIVWSRSGPTPMAEKRVPESFSSAST